MCIVFSIAQGFTQGYITVKLDSIDRYGIPLRQTTTSSPRKETTRVCWTSGSRIFYARRTCEPKLKVRNFLGHSVIVIFFFPEDFIEKFHVLGRTI